MKSISNVACSHGAIADSILTDVFSGGNKKKKALTQTLADKHTEGRLHCFSTCFPWFWFEEYMYIDGIKTSTCLPWIKTSLIWRIQMTLSGPQKVLATYFKHVVNRKCGDCDSRGSRDHSLTMRFDPQLLPSKCQSVFEKDILDMAASCVALLCECVSEHVKCYVL